MKDAARVKRAHIKAMQIAGESPQRFIEVFVAEGGLHLPSEKWGNRAAVEKSLLPILVEALNNGWGGDKAVFVWRSSAAGKALLRTADVDNDDCSELVVDAINRASGCAYSAGARLVPSVVGFRYLRSPRQDWPTISNLFAEANLYGLGAGAYPTPETTPWPAYLGDLSYVVAVFEDELAKATPSSPETIMAALGRLTPDEREGVLGPTKAKYFGLGLLRSWMVRSPLSSVQRRLVRQGHLIENELETDPDDDYDDDE